MKSILTKITMGLLSLSLLATPATAAIERKAAPATEAASETATSAAAFTGTVTRSQKREVRKKLLNALRDGEDNKLLLVIIAILLPPLAVYLHQGEINSKFWIALVLWLLFYIPGLIYALITILG